MSIDKIKNKRRFLSDLKSTFSELKNLYKNQDFQKYHESSIHDSFYTKYLETMDSLEELLDYVEESDPYINEQRGS